MNSETLLEVSKWVLYFGTLLVAAGTIGVSHFTSVLDREKDKKIDVLVDGNSRLEKGNVELLSRVEIYQTDLASKQEEIDSLKQEAARAKRGLVSVWDFNGAKRDARPGVMNTVVGEEFGVFQQLVKLEGQKQYEQLIALATQQIARTPDWLTPYLFRGIGFANRGDLPRAVTDLRHVVETSAGDPAYAQAIELLNRIQQATK